MNQGSNGWFATLEPTGKPDILTGEERCEWIVVGAGCCGLAVAHRLAELSPDERILLVESSYIGHGASGRNSGFMLNAHAHGLKTDIERLKAHSRLWSAGLDWLRNTVRDYQIQCDWSEWGRLYAAVGEAGTHHLETLCSTFDTLGFGYERLGRHEMSERTGSEHYACGIHADGSTLVQPAALMRGLGAALPANVRICEQSPVTNVTREGSEWLVTTNDGVARAPGLVMAAGAYTPELGFAKHRSVPLSLYASMTRPLNAAEQQGLGTISEFGILPTSPNGSTVRLTRDKRIVMRNTTRYARYSGNEEDDLGTVIASHREAIRRRWPALADIEIEHTWGGLMSVTRNGGALFAKVGENAYAVGTSDVSPVTRGVVAGRLLAEHILGRESELLSSQLALAPASLVPPDPLLRWVANHRLRKITSSEAEEL